MIGTTLSHYTITAKLGEGGMGEVYRAEDTRLKREVAIKVLPEEVARDPERLDRFEREAHLLAALNHPNIAAIYGLEKHEGHTFLVLELVEGEDLQERLERGSVPVDEALEIGLQIADALEEAHNRGIVHRDLKPANVKLTPDGKVKVLDFGLAKAWSGELSGDSRPSNALSQSPTMHYAGTVAGVILGTAAYMSPEQARGRPVDRRADVWAFGVLLWEILTGQRLFPGETVTDVIAAVLTRDADIETLPDGTPLAVRRLVERCLRKDPRSRLPDIGSARLELQEVLAGTSESPVDLAPELQPPSEADRKRRVRERMAWAVATLVGFGLAATAALVQIAAEPNPEPVTRFAIGPPEGWQFARDAVPVPSPDGRQVVFAAWREAEGSFEGEVMLWVRALDSVKPRPLVGTEGNTIIRPFWSPDGRFLVFAGGGELRKIDLQSGAVQMICPLPRPFAGGGDWSESGTIFFSSGGSAGRLYSVGTSGGVPQLVMEYDDERGEVSHFLPQLLPDGRRLLFVLSSSKGPDVAGHYVASLDAPEDRRRVLGGIGFLRYASGYLLRAWEGTLYAAPFDAGRAEVEGEEVSIASSVGTASFGIGFGEFSASPGGTLAYLSGSPPTSDMQLAWVDRSGERLTAIGPPDAYGQIALSPDDQTAAVEIRVGDGEYDLWVMDLERGVSSRVTVTPGEERDPVWAADGRTLVFTARQPDGADLRQKGLKASDPATVVANSEDEDIPESWSRDGRTLLVVRRTLDDMQSVWAVPIDRQGEAEPVLDTGFRVDEPQLSPDGRWLAYVSPESGLEEVYVEPYRRDGLRVKVSVAGGGQPKWRSDGTELFYTTPEGRLMTVAVRDDGDRIGVELPTELFEMAGLQGPGYDDYAVSKDGQRFLIKVPIEEEAETRLHIVTNWTSLLE